MTPDSLHRLRDRRFRRLPTRRVQGERAALAFVRDVGFCSTTDSRRRRPLWEAVAGKAIRAGRGTRTTTPASASPGTSGHSAGEQARVLQQAPQGPAPRSARSVPDVHARARPPAGARLPRGVRGRATLPYGPPDHGRCSPSTAVRASCARTCSCWSPRRPASSSARWRSSSRALARQERGALRADFPIAGTYSRRGCRTRSPKTADCRGRRPSGADRALHARRGVHDRAAARTAVRPRVRRGHAGGEDPGAPGRCGPTARSAAGPAAG